MWGVEVPKTDSFNKGGPYEILNEITQKDLQYR